MSRSRILSLTPLLATSFLTGCIATIDSEQYSFREAGFGTVRAGASKALKKKTVWVQSQGEAKAVAKRVHALTHKKTLTADQAVQVALLNNKGLQAAYANVGSAAAAAWQETMLVNPNVSVGLIGIGTPQLEAFRAIEGLMANNILAMLTRERRVAIADTRFEQAQLQAIEATLKLAADTRRAWITSVSAFERVTYLNKALIAADAASELAKELGKSGAINKAGQARQHVFYAELTGQAAQARLAAKLAKEELTRLMGLWGSEVTYYVPNRLPTLPRRVKKKSAIEREALHRRVDLQIARLELKALAQSYGLTDATRYVTDIGLLAGAEVERSVDENGKKSSELTGRLEVDFSIPIFDSGEARLRKGETAYMRAANQLAEKAVNIRSEARAAYTNYRSTREIALHYRRNVLPLRTKIEQEALLTYNGMITSTFELLADTRAKVDSLLLSVDAKREFWLADANMSAAIYGGGTSVAAGGGGGAAMAAAGGPGH